jgi:predicted MFS family arabinose efflux permease
MVRLFALYRNAFTGIRKNAWLLAVVMFINRSGSMVLLFTSLYLTNELGFTIGQAGIVLSLYGVGSILGSYAGGWLTDRYDHFRIMIFSLVSCGLILLLMLTTTSLILISAIVFLYAFCSDMLRPAVSAAIADASTPENRTRSVSLMRLAINLGFSVGPAMGGFVAHYLGYTWLFVIDAATSFAAALLLLFYLPVKSGHHSEKRKEVLADSSTSAYRDVPFLFFVLLVALYGTCFFQIFASIPQYFSRVCKYDEDTIGLLLALNGLLVVLVEMPLVARLEKSKNIFRFIIAGTLCLPVAFALLSFGKGLMLFSVIYTFIITSSEIFAMPFMMNLVLSRPPMERQGQYSALYSIAFGLSNIVAPLVGLGLADKFGFGSMFAFLIMLSLMTATGFYRLQKEKWNY